MIVVGDCRSVLAEMEAASFDAVITDPPYGTEFGTGHGGGYGRRELGARYIHGDADLSVFATVLPAMVRVLRSPGWLIAFASPQRQHEVADLMLAHDLVVFRHCVWNKRQPGLGFPIRNAHEAIVVAHTGAEPPRASHGLLSVLDGHLLREHARRNHPHVKPVHVMETLVRWATPEGGAVLDPFCGSGTTGVACVHAGRRFLGIEIDPEWADVARRRFSEAVPSMFVQSTHQEEIA